MLVQPLAHHLADDVKQPLALGVLRFFRRPLLRMLARIIDYRGKKNNTGRWQRQPCPPVMNALRVRPDAWHLVVGRCVVDLGKRQRDFDELLADSAHYTHLHRSVSRFSRSIIG